MDEEDKDILGKIRLEFDGTPESVERNIERVAKWLRQLNNTKPSPQEEKYKELLDKVNELYKSTDGRKSEDWTLEEVVTLTELWIEHCVLKGDYKSATRFAQSGLNTIRERIKGLLKW